MGLNEDIQNGNTVSQLKVLGYSASDLINYEGHTQTWTTTWQQVGNDIYGEAEGDQFGKRVSINSDGTIVAIGSNDANDDSGLVRVYQWNGTDTWTQMGSDFEGNGDVYCGYSVSLSSDGQIVAIGYPKEETSQNLENGLVRVFEWNGTDTWVKLGGDIPGSKRSAYGGASVSLNGDGTVVAFGNPYHDTNGVVNVYKYSDGSWTKRGTDSQMKGDGNNVELGTSVSLSDDGTTVVTGAHGGAGHAAVYKWDGSAWTQLGTNMNGDEQYDRFGISVSINGDGTIVAIGAADDYYNSKGYVRVYSLNGTAWTKIGDIDSGEWDRSGFSISLSGDGTILAIGAYVNKNLPDAERKGRVRVYQYNNSTWSQLYEDIVGSNSGDKFGWSVSISSDGKYVAGGAIHHRGNDIRSTGQVKVFNELEGGTQVFEPFTVNDLKNDFTIQELHDGGYTATELKAGGYTASEFKAAGFTTTQMKGAEFTATEMKGAGFTATELYGQTLTVKDPSLQLGQDIEGGTAGDLAGHSVSINQDGTIIAVGAHRALNENSEGAAGSIKIYQWNGTDTWIQLGSTIYGDASWDVLGQSVSLSSDGTIVATGAIEQRDNVKGYVKVFQWNGTDTWIQLGSTIYGTSNNDRSGISVSLSSDGTILAIGAHRNDAGPGTDSGQVRVFEWNDSSWVQLGNDIYGEASSDMAGSAVSLSSDGTIVAIGAQGNMAGGNGAGHVRVYQWNGTAWTKIGQDIDGVADYERMGTAVSLNSDGTIIACGAPYGSGNKGHVKIYKWNGTDTWTQLGSTIIGDAASDETGKSVSLNSDGSIVAIGYGGGGDDALAGRVKVYQWNGTDWTKLVEDINGKGYIEQAFQVSLTRDGTTLVIGGEGYSGNIGRAKVYRIRELSGFGASLSELITAGFTATELKGAGFTVNDLENDFTATEMKEAEFTATEMRDAGILLDAVRGIYTDDELIAAGYSLSVESMKASGKTIDEVIATNKYTLSEIRTGSDTTDGQTGYTAAEFKAAAFTTTEMKGAGFTATEMKEAEFTATELKAAGYNATELKAAVFTATQMKAAGYNATEMKAAVFTATQMKEAGYNATQMKDGQYALSELKGVYEVQELHDTGFTVAEMKTALYTAGQLTGIYNIQEMHDGGYRVDDMKKAGHGIDDLKDSYEMDEIFEGGFTNASDLFSDGEGYSINQLKTIKQARPLNGEINHESDIENLSSNDFIYIYGRDGVLRAKIPIKSISTGTEGGNLGKKTINLD